jgi:hypothetical protein
MGFRILQYLNFAIGNVNRKDVLFFVVSRMYEGIFGALKNIRNTSLQGNIVNEVNFIGLRS